LPRPDDNGHSHHLGDPPKKEQGRVFSPTLLFFRNALRLRLKA
jgi:hypothetical protein